MEARIFLALTLYWACLFSFSVQELKSFSTLFCHQQLLECKDHLQWHPLLLYQQFKENSCVYCPKWIVFLVKRRGRFIEAPSVKVWWFPTIIRIFFENHLNDYQIKLWSPIVRNNGAWNHTSRTRVNWI